MITYGERRKKSPLKISKDTIFNVHHLHLRNDRTKTCTERKMRRIFLCVIVAVRHRCELNDEDMGDAILLLNNRIGKWLVVCGQLDSYLHSLYRTLFSSCARNNVRLSCLGEDALLL